MNEQLSLHLRGTYACVKPRRADAERLKQWLRDAGVPNRVGTETLHCTVTYSHRPCPELVALKIERPIEAVVTGWSVFIHDTKQVLCAMLKSEGISELHEKIKREYGATHDFPDYRPHVTCAKDYVKDAPSNWPEFPIIFDRIEVKPIKE